MNLKALSDVQAELDLQINLERQLDHSKYLKEKAISMCVELGELLNERPMIFKYWSSKTGNKEKALTEYVDGIHFLLSFGNSINFDFEKFKYVRPKELDQRDLILGLFSMFGGLLRVKQFKEALTYYLFLAEKLNFTSEEVERAYHEKVKVNYERQENGY